MNTKTFLKTTISGALLLMTAIILGIAGSTGRAAASSTGKAPLPPVVQFTPHAGYQYFADHQTFLGIAPPAHMPYTFTYAITDTTGTWTTTATVSCFQMRFVSGVAPAGTVAGTPTFSWTGIHDPKAVYGVELNDSTGKRIWSNHAIAGTSIVYDGPALTPGTTYTYYVLVESSSTCSEQASSFVTGSFTYK